MTVFRYLLSQSPWIGDCMWLPNPFVWFGMWLKSVLQCWFIPFSSDSVQLVLIQPMTELEYLESCSSLGKCVCDSATMFADVCICSWRAWKYDIYRKKVIYLYFASIYYIWLSVIYSYLFMRFMFLERGLRKEPAGEILGHGRSRSGKRGQPPSRQSCRFHCGLGLGVQPFLFQRD